MKVVLPLTWPPLLAAAEEAARAWHNAACIVQPPPDDDGWLSWHGAEDEYKRLVIAAKARLLSDLTRPESRDWLARELAGMLGLEVGCTAPEWALATDRSGWWLGGHPLRGHFFRPGDCPPLGLLDPDDERRVGGPSRMADLLDRQGHPDEAAKFREAHGPRLVDVVALGCAALCVYGDKALDEADQAITPEMAARPDAWEQWADGQGEALATWDHACRWHRAARALAEEYRAGREEP